MSDLAPLILLWALSQSGGGSSSSSRRSSSNPPDWPTTRSPPPPLPAFVPFVPEPSAAPATSLTDIHQTTLATPKPKGKPSKATSLKQGALNAAKGAASHATSQAQHAATSALRRAASSFSFRDPFANLMPSQNPMVSKPVSELQGLINVRGGTLKRDGLYGPKTAAAWSSIARSNGLSPDIQRVNAKTARVATHTFEVLNVPPIL